MNTFNFLQTGGFPMDVNVLDNMQKAYQLFNGLGALAGDLSIIKGCELTGTTVSNGVVYIHGEVLEFRSGVVSDNVVVVEEPSTGTFEDGSVKPIHFVRYATFGVATTSYPWAGFKRAFPTKDIAGALDTKQDKTAMVAILERLTLLEAKNAVFQEGGGMVLWNKPAAQIPAGWAEVQDWRGRMPVGWDPIVPDEYQSEVFDTVGKMGGRTYRHISIDHMPSHNHEVKAYAGVAGGNNYNVHINSPTNGASYDRTSHVGGGQPFNIMNPYRVVLFIEFVGL